MAVNNLLSNLKKVKSTGKNRWVSCCPAHGDKSPSLSIRLLDDERILIHCFAGCEVASVLDAIGLGFSDIMPPSQLEHKRSVHSPFSTADALRCVSHEAQIVALYAISLAKDLNPSNQDKERLLKASERIKGALQGAGL